jgi:predicted RNase H-like HicB family nuclease
MPFVIETEQDKDGRWIAEVSDLPGVLAYGQTKKEAIDRSKALALRVLADRLQTGEAIPSINQLFTMKIDPALLEPRDEWERKLFAMGVDCGVSLSDSALSREEMYD